MLGRGAACCGAELSRCARCRRLPNGGWGGAVAVALALTVLLPPPAQVRPGLAKMAVPKGLWPFIVKYEAALRSVSLEAGPEAGRRTSLDGAAGGGGRAARRFAPGWAKLARSGRRGGGGEAAPRGERHAPQPPAGKLFRTVVLATGVKVMYDLMVRR